MLRTARRRALVARRCGRLQRFACDVRSNQVIEQREFAIEIRVAARDDRALPVLSHPASRLLAVARVQAVEHVHPADDLPEDRERIAVVARVVSQVDVHLRIRCARHRVPREGEAAAHVAPEFWVVCKLGVRPRGIDRRIAAQSPLHDVMRVDPVKARVVVVAESNQVVESIGAVRRVRANALDDKVAFARLESRIPDLGRLAAPLRVARVEEQPLGWNDGLWASGAARKSDDANSRRRTGAPRTRHGSGTVGTTYVLRRASRYSPCNPWITTNSRLTT